MRWRFLAHLVGACGFVTLSLVGYAPSWTLPFLVIGAIWVTNLYNFMDGSDGLAGGMALFGFAAYGAAAWRSSDVSVAAANLCVVGAAAGFLRFNFSPARIFMGDAGSIPLGFLAASVGSYGWSRGLWPAWFPLLVFSPFWVDATTTLLARQLRGEKVWLAHRSHYYQRLVLMGWGHRKVAVVEYVLMAAVAATGVWALGESAVGQGIVVGFWGIAYAVAMRLVDARWTRFRHSDRGH
jgi:UDP-N-acetylmuramyl pentapeptide phosphotransferase/UDP-N-acetylglucosamine-1-phosphate transferase